MGYRNQPYPNRLKVTRQNAGYQQKHVTKMLGHANNRVLSDWENERTMPNGTSLMKLCIIYGKTPKELYPEYYDQIGNGLILTHK